MLIDQYFNFLDPVDPYFHYADPDRSAGYWGTLVVPGICVWASVLGFRLGLCLGLRLGHPGNKRAVVPNVWAIRGFQRPEHHSC